MLPGLRKRTPNRKVGQLTSPRRGQLSNFFTDVIQVTLSPTPPPFLLWLSPSHGDNSEGETTAVRFFTVTQNWAIFSFTLEHKKASLQKKIMICLIEPINIRQRSNLQIWDKGRLRVPFPSDVQRCCSELVVGIASMGKLPDLDACDRGQIVVNKRTVQRSLHRMRFESRRPTRVPLLNARHRAASLAWVREHRDWSIED
ncbi:hypothetical protein TNCV_2654471 [Trichonephila clavipes]|nr:hypothetical protein TNCV_2654471 [Trichonephila clavipes]